VTTITTTNTAAATPCATILTPAYSAPVAAKGWKAQLIATNLTNPRSIKFDSNGGLLVLEARTGLRRLTFDDNGGTCLSVRNSTLVIDDEEVSSDSIVPRRRRNINANEYVAQPRP
jgi:glucose/arabinose dehydrogenase